MKTFQMYSKTEKKFVGRKLKMTPEMAAKGNANLPKWSTLEWRLV